MNNSDQMPPMRLVTILILLIILPRLALTQGWVAEVDLGLIHDHYAYEKISKATLSFSSVTVSGTSENGRLQFVLNGNDPLSGNITLVVDGLAWEPYDPSEPYSEMISGSHSGNFSTTCTTGFFEIDGQTPLEHIYLWIRIYPRMNISSFLQQCDKLMLSTITCSPEFHWEVSESSSAGFIPIPGKSGSTISITREELIALGFENPYGRKYFRVTGLPHTTSQLQPVDIYYPPPSAQLVTTPPKCHNGKDGSLVLEIESSFPSAINDYVITLFKEGPPQIAVKQDFILDGSVIMLRELGAGNYAVKIENNSSIETYGNCWANYSFTLKNPEPVTIARVEISDFNGYQIKCAGGNEGSIKIFPSGGTGTFSTYSWAPEVSTKDFAAGLLAGTYRVKVKDSNGCWSEEVPYPLLAAEELTVNLRSIGGKNGYDVSCVDKTDGEILADVQGGVPDYSYKWSDGITTEVRTGVGIGHYSVSVSDANGCTTTAAVALQAPKPIDFAIAEISGIKCPGTASGALEVQSISNTIGHRSFQWSSGEPFQQIANKEAGTYMATVTDEQGCSAQRYHTLVDPLPYSLEIIASSDYHGSPIQCNGDDNGSLQAIVRDPAANEIVADQYIWSRNGSEFLTGTDVQTASGLASGVYKLEITYATFCKMDQTFILHEPDPIEVTITSIRNYNGMAISCAGKTDGAIQATATGGTGNMYTFQWTNGVEGHELINIGEGTYTVRALDVNGCEAHAEKILASPDTLLSEITVLSNYHGQPVSCAGASDARLKVAAAGGTSPFRYTWNTGHTSAEVWDIPAGNYSIQTTDANGCTTTTDIDVLDPSPVRAMITRISDYNGYGISCNGMADGEIISKASGGTGVYDFAWPGSTNNQAAYSNLKAGRYKMIATDQNGCQDFTEAVISEPPSLTLQVLNAINVTCNEGSNGEIHLVAQGGVGEYQYASGEEIWQSEPTIKRLRAGTHVIHVEDRNGCQQSLTQALTEPAELSIQFQNIEPALCGDPKGKVTAWVEGGTGNYTFEWTNSDNLPAGYESNISGLSSGIYYVKVRDENFCERNGSVGIPSVDGPKIEVDGITPASCSYSMDGRASLKIAGGNGPFTLRWPDGQETTDALNLRKGIYLVEVTDINRCKTVQTVEISAPDSLHIQLSEMLQPDCHGHCNGKLTVLAQGGNGNYRYEWNNATGQTAYDLCAGVYQVQVTDQKECLAIGQFTLDQPDPIQLKLSSKQPSCPGFCDGQVSVEASGGMGAFRYLWSNGEKGVGIRDLCAGEYNVFVEDTNHCPISASYSLENRFMHKIDLGGAAILCQGQTHPLDAGPVYTSYFWQSDAGFRSTDRSVVISEPATYWIEATDQYGCVARDTFLLETTSDLLKANFLLTTEASVGDTVAVIDISWPLPENIVWNFPEEMRRLHDFGDVVFGQFERSGVYRISLAATLGDCRDEMMKVITVLDNGESREESGRLGHESFVREFTLFPNPNDGVFGIAVEFVEQSPMLLTIWNMLTSTKIAQLEDRGQRFYFKNIDLRPLSAGAYSVRLDHKNGTRYIRFIVR